MRGGAFAASRETTFESTFIETTNIMGATVCRSLPHGRLICVRYGRTPCRHHQLSFDITLLVQAQPHLSENRMACPPACPAHSDDSPKAGAHDLPNLCIRVTLVI